VLAAITALRAVLVALASTAVVAAQLDLPHDYWRGQRPALYLALVILTYTTALEVFRLAGPVLRPHRTLRYQQNIRAILTAGLVRVGSTFRLLELDRLFLQVFVVKGIGRFEYLELVCRLPGSAESVRPTPPPPRIWRRGQGVPGLAWQTQQFEVVDWSELYRAASGQGRMAWEAGSRTYGLSWPELQRTAGAGRIAAIPVFVDGKVAGCVTIDCTLSLDELRSDKMKEILVELSGFVAALEESHSSRSVRGMAMVWREVARARRSRSGEGSDRIVA
jgi:hypothetical protein